MVDARRGTMDRSLQNVLVVALGFLLLFTAYGGLQSLQVRRPLAPPASGIRVTAGTWLRSL